MLRNEKKNRLGSFLLMGLLCCAACTPNGDPVSAEIGPDPMTTVRELLQLHSLLGRQPEERSEKAKNKEISTASLEPLFVNLDTHDPFLRDLYIGFVVGALARNQGRLFVTKRDNRADVRAGKLTVKMVQAKDRYKIDLDKTIPPEIKKRAAEEKTRYHQAGGSLR